MEKIINGMEDKEVLEFHLNLWETESKEFFPGEIEQLKFEGLIFLLKQKLKKLGFEAGR